MEEFSNTFNKEIISFGALTRFRKSGSGGWAFTMEEFSKGSNKEMIGFGALARLRK